MATSPCVRFRSFSPSILALSFIFFVHIQRNNRVHPSPSRSFSFRSIYQSAPVLLDFIPSLPSVVRVTIPFVPIGSIQDTRLYFPIDNRKSFHEIRNVGFFFFFCQRNSLEFVQSAHGSFLMFCAHTRATRWLFGLEPRANPVSIYGWDIIKENYIYI